MSVMDQSVDSLLARVPSQRIESLIRRWVGPSAGALTVSAVHGALFAKTRLGLHAVPRRHRRVHRLLPCRRLALTLGGRPMTILTNDR